ncbi:hypothetical protein C8R47DRAFT_1296201 [Mycena vitilis]|nr:hypothetical protein C8R47DRAFT_1296201 [Mycena vitilis]
MPANTRSSRPTRQVSDVVLLTDSDDVAIKRTTTKQNAKNTGLRKENLPINSGEIIEISSDEDEEPVVPRNTVANSRLQEKIRQLERENARIKRENAEIKKKQAASADLEDQITCEVCSSKMWSPFILPDCGHTFCQQDLVNWFDTALKQHRKVYPHYNPSAPAVNMYHPFQQQMQLPLPPYSCPKCREKVRSKPIQNFAVKNFVRAVAGQAGESSPKKTVANSANVWGKFFPQ